MHRPRLTAPAHPRLTICLAFLLVSCLAPIFGRSDRIIPVPGRVIQAGGLEKIQFELPAGQVTVNLPDDLAAGDTITGSVVTSPAGTSDDERQQNAAQLQGLQIEVAGATAPASDVTHWTIPTDTPS